MPCTAPPAKAGAAASRWGLCHRRQRLHSFLDNPCQRLTAHAVKKVVSCVQREPDVFWLVPVASGHSRGMQGSPACPHACCMCNIQIKSQTHKEKSSRYKKNKSKPG